jgi:hypothetical protein
MKLKLVQLKTTQAKRVVRIMQCILFGSLWTRADGSSILASLKGAQDDASKTKVTDEKSKVFRFRL